jgi:hypothetical protein
MMVVMAVDQEIHDAFECTNPIAALSTQKNFDAAPTRPHPMAYAR